MKLKTHGKNISAVEVSHIDTHGLWLWVNDKEYFLSYDEYPWFKEAKVNQILNVKLLHGFHLYWPELDVDLEIKSLDKPRDYPLKYAMQR
jgi:hypothetical protein